MPFSFKIKEKIVVKTILRKECEEKMKNHENTSVYFEDS